MARPILTVSATPVFDTVIEPGTIMEHNDPPQMLVMVTEVDPQGVDFNGLSLSDGVYYGTNPMNEWGWDGSVFHIFKGSVTLSQGV